MEGSEGRWGHIQSPHLSSRGGRRPAVGRQHQEHAPEVNYIHHHSTILQHQHLHSLSLLLQFFSLNSYSSISYLLKFFILVSYNKNFYADLIPSKILCPSLFKFFLCHSNYLSIFIPVSYHSKSFSLIFSALSFDTHAHVVRAAVLVIIFHELNKASASGQCSVFVEQSLHRDFYLRHTMIQQHVSCIQNTSGRKVTTDDEGYGGEGSELAMTECSFWKFDNSSPSPGWPDLSPSWYGVLRDMQICSL